jgi:hypothetical protein
MIQSDKLPISLDPFRLVNPLARVLARWVNRRLGSCPPMGAAYLVS